MTDQRQRRAANNAAIAGWVAPVFEVVGMVSFPDASVRFIFWWTMAAFSLGVVAAVITYHVSMRSEA